MKKLRDTVLYVVRSKLGRKFTITFGVAISFTVYAISVTSEDKHHFTGSDGAVSYRVNQRQVGSFIQKYEELKWYSEELKGELLTGEMPSIVSLGKHVPKFDRTLLALQSLANILDGKYDDYLEFINDQEKAERLQWDQFQNLQTEAKSAVSVYRGLSPGQIREVLEFAIVLNEIASSKILQKKAWVYEIAPRDSRDFVQEVIVKHPDIFPTFSRFNFEQQRLLQEIYGLLDLQKIFTLKDLRLTFEALKRSNVLHNDPSLFELAFLVEESLFAGSRGDLNACSSLTLNRYGYNNLVASRQAIALLKDSTEIEAFKYYVGKRADWLGFDPGSPLNRVLTRFGAMMELFTESDGKVLKENFLRLKPEELSLIVSEFDEVQMANHLRVFTNINALFKNLSENRQLGSCQRDRVVSSVRVGFPFLAKVVTLAVNNDTGTGLEIDLEEAALLAQKDPMQLNAKEVTIEKNGKVHL